MREMKLQVLITGSLMIFKGHFKCHNEFCLKACCIPFSFSTDERMIIFVVGYSSEPDCFIRTFKQLQYR